MKRMLTALALAAGLVLPGGHALAAPTNAPNVFIAPLTCTTPQGTVELVIASNAGQAGEHGQGTAQDLNTAFVTSGGTGKIIPTSAALSFSGPDYNQTVTPSKGNARGPAAGIPAVCTFALSFSDGGQTYTFSGTVVGYWLP